MSLALRRGLRCAVRYWDAPALRRGKRAGCSLGRGGRFALRRPLGGECGQATVEYVVVGLVIIIVAAGVAALWRYVAGGGFAELAAAHPSHVLNGVEGAADALMY